jgi:peptidyl-prolyl cis-trans isomerase A (cyclophilin A)
MSGATVARRTVLGAAALLATSPVRAATAKPRVELMTAQGRIVVELEDRRAPLTAANFLHYVAAAKYDGGAFYRSTHPPGAPGDGTIVAGPAAGQRPFPPIAHESTTKTGLRHVDGTVSLGRFAPGSATDTFFICLGEEPYLDAHPGAKGDNLGYAAFGQVIEGMAVVRRIHGRPAHGKSPFPDQKGQWLTRPVPILHARRIGAPDKTA